MDYKVLGQTDLNVSRLCLGTMTMGWTSGKKDSFEVMDSALENGINFFDTADVYSYWAAGNPVGCTRVCGSLSAGRTSSPSIRIPSWP
jgi:aryl-alcohol dehydrogenase-like predicted oxidoreductase